MARSQRVNRPVLDNAGRAAAQRSYNQLESQRLAQVQRNRNDPTMQYLSAYDNRQGRSDTATKLLNNMLSSVRGTGWNAAMQQQADKYFSRIDPRDTGTIQRLRNGFDDVLQGRVNVAPDASGHAAGMDNVVRMHSEALDAMRRRPNVPPELLRASEEALENAKRQQSHMTFATRDYEDQLNRRERQNAALWQGGGAQNGQSNRQQSPFQQPSGQPGGGYNAYDGSQRQPNYSAYGAPTNQRPGGQYQAWGQQGGSQNPWWNSANQAQPIQPPSQGTPYGQQPQGRMPGMHDSDGDGVDDRLRNIYRPPGAAQPAPSQGTPYGQQFVGGWPDPGNYAYAPPNMRPQPFMQSASFGGQQFANPADAMNQRAAFVQSINDSRAGQAQQWGMGNLQAPNRNWGELMGQAGNMVQQGWQNPLDGLIGQGQGVSSAAWNGMYPSQPMPQTPRANIAGDLASFSSPEEAMRQGVTGPLTQVGDGWVSFPASNIVNGRAVYF